jgi:hypothetical protein
MAHCTKSQTWIGNQIATPMPTWGCPMVVPAWALAKQVHFWFCPEGHVTLPHLKNFNVFINDFRRVHPWIVCRHIFQIQTFWGQLFHASWKFICVMLFIWFPTQHMRSFGWVVYPKSKHTQIWFPNFHLFVPPLLWPSLLLRVHFKFNTTTLTTTSDEGYGCTNV